MQFTEENALLRGQATGAPVVVDVGSPTVQEKMLTPASCRMAGLMGRYRWRLVRADAEWCQGVVRGIRPEG